MNGMYVAGNNSIKLKNTESLFMCLVQAVLHEHFPDMLSPDIFPYRIRGITDMSAPSLVIRVKDVHADDFILLCINRHAGIRLRSEEPVRILIFQLIQLGKCIAVRYHLIPYFRHSGCIMAVILPQHHLHCRPPCL